MFYDEFVELLEKLGSPGELTAAALLELFTGQDADGYTWYMRLLTSGKMLMRGSVRRFVAGSTLPSS